MHMPLADLFLALYEFVKFRPRFAMAVVVCALLDNSFPTNTALHLSDTSIPVTAQGSGTYPQTMYGVGYVTWGPSYPSTNR